MAFKRKPPPGNVRRVISLGNNFRGVTNNKQGRLVQFESEQERKLILLLERDTSVADYISQPETIHFCAANGHQRKYTPDFQVWRTNGQIELHEVTIESRRSNRESLQQREIAARLVCQQRGWKYTVHTDQTLPSGYEYANLDFLSAFRSQAHANSEVLTWWLEQLSGQQPVHPRTVLARAETGMEPGILLNGLYHLLWYGRIEMDWQQPFFWHASLHPQAHIWLSQDKNPQGDGR